jgi:hypothetical protein
MNQNICHRIRVEFSEEDFTKALTELESITLKHVMAESQYNLDNTLNSILNLSKGDLKELKMLVNVAKMDFRDVIYWDSLEKKKSKQK